MNETLIYDISTAGLGNRFFFALFMCFFVLSLSGLNYLARFARSDNNEVHKWVGIVFAVVFPVVLGISLISGFSKRSTCFNNIKNSSIEIGFVTGLKLTGKYEPQTSSFSINSKHFTIHGGGAINPCGYVQNPSHFFNVQEGKKLKIQYFEDVIFKIYLVE